MLDLFQGSENTMKNLVDTNRDDFSTFKRDAQDEFNKMSRMIETVKDDLVNFKEEKFKEVGEEFNKVHRGMEKMVSDIRVLKEDTTELKVNFARLQGQTHNRSVHNPYIRITPVVAYQPGKGMVEPEVFPKNGQEFWKLKRPNNAQERKTLLYLVKFYDIQGYQTWGQADLGTRSDGSSNITTSVEDQESETHSDGSADITVEDNSCEESQSLQDAVEMYPHIAVEALAAIVGLVEDNFIRFRTRAAELDRRPKRPATKRLQGKLLDKEKTKRQQPLGKRPDEQDTLVGPVTTIPFHKFNLSQGSEDGSKAPTVLTSLEWDYGPESTGPKLTVNNLYEDKVWLEQNIDHSESPTEHD